MERQTLPPPPAHIPDFTSAAQYTYRTSAESETYRPYIERIEDFVARLRARWRRERDEA